MKEKAVFAKKKKDDACPRSERMVRDSKYCWEGSTVAAEK
jgi:hypothetical protein